MGGQLERGLNIDGGTDGTPIGNVGDRLKVDSSNSPIPSVNVIHIVGELKNESSRDMNVNGSVTPVIFTHAPTSGINYLSSIRFFLEDTGLTSPLNFGAISGGLTNGVILRIKSQGTNFDYYTTKTNLDITVNFRIEVIPSASTGFLESSDIITYVADFSVPIPLLFSSSDSVSVIIQDNLVSLNNFRCSAFYWRAQ